MGSEVVAERISAQLALQLYGMQGSTLCGGMSDAYLCLQRACLAYEQEVKGMRSQI